MGNKIHKALRRQDITFEDKDQSLRDDVRMLGTLVGQLIREQGGEELFEFVENARLRSIRRREDNESLARSWLSSSRTSMPNLHWKSFAVFPRTFKW